MEWLIRWITQGSRRSASAGPGLHASLCSDGDASPPGAADRSLRRSIGGVRAAPTACELPIGCLSWSVASFQAISGQVIYLLCDNPRPWYRYNMDQGLSTAQRRHLSIASFRSRKNRVGQVLSWVWWVRGAIQQMSGGVTSGEQALPNPLAQATESADGWEEAEKGDCYTGSVGGLSSVLAV